MPRGVTLSKLLENLALETGETINPNARNQVRTTHVRMLQRIQEQFYEQYDWPFLRVWRDISLAAGQKLYNPPSDLDLSRVEKAYTQFGRQWVPLTRLLDPPDYADFDSDEDERFNPQMRWYLREDGQFEVWPLPAGNDQKIRFVGTKSLSPLVDDSDTCDLDSNLLVLYAAASILARRNARDAQIKAGEAQQHLNRLRARLAPKQGFTFLNDPPRQHTREPFGPKPPDYYTSGS